MVVPRPRLSRHRDVHLSLSFFVISVQFSPCLPLFNKPHLPHTNLFLQQSVKSESIRLGKNQVEAGKSRVPPISGRFYLSLSLSLCVCVCVCVCVFNFVEEEGQNSKKKKKETRGPRPRR